MAAIAPKKQKSMATYVIHVTIMLAIMFIGRFLPPPLGLPQVGMQVVCAFLGTMYGWVFIGLGMPAILGMLALALSDYTTIGKVLQTGFGNSTVGMLFVIFLLAAYIEHVGLNAKIVNYLLSRKFLKGRTNLFMLFYFFAIILINIASQSWLSVLFFVEFVREMCQKTEMKAQSKEASVLMQETIMVGLIGSMVLPIKDQPIARMAFYTAGTGEAWSPLTYTMVSLPLSIIMILVILVVNKFILRVDYSCLVNANLVDENETTLNKQQKLAVKFVIALCASMILPGFLPTTFPVIGKLGMTGCPFIVLAALLIVRQDGKPVVTLKDLAKYVNWDIIFLMGAVFSLVAALSADEIGVSAVIQSSLSGLMNLSPFLFMFVVVMVSGFLTQIMSNSVCAAMFITSFCMMADILPPGISLAGLTLLIAYSTDLSCWLPSATSANAYGYGQTDVVDFKEYFKAGFINMTIQLLIVGTVGVALVSVFYKGVV